MEYVKEKNINNYPKPVSLESTEIIIDQMRKKVCKISIGNGIQGTGFFCKIPFNNNLLPVLITNNHIIDKSILFTKRKIILLSINNIDKEIELDNRIKWTNEEFDITIIEIKEKDGIKNYLELDDNIRNKSNIAFIGKSIYILHFPGSEKVAVSYGIIKEENKNYDFNHLCCTGNGSSGSPIIDLSNNKVIGIHKMASKRFDYNIGLFIKYAINEFNKQNYNNNYNEIKTGIKIEDEDKKDEIYLKSELRIKKPTITQLLNQRFSCEILLNLLSSGERCVFHAHPDRKYRFYTPLKKNIKNFTQDDLELEFINRVNYFQAHFIDVSEHGEFRYPDNLSKKEIEDDIHKWGYYASLGRRDILYNAYEKLLKLLEGDKASLEIPLKNDKNSNKINKDFFSGVNKNEIEKIFKDGTIESITSFELEDNAKKDYEKGDYSIKAKLYLDPPKNKSI